MLSMLWRDLFKFGIFMLMLSIRVRNWCVCSGYASVPDSYAQRTHQFLTRMLRVRISSWCVCSAFCEGNALCARISTWCVCSVHAPVPYSYAQCTHQFLTSMLRAGISSWRACSVHASIPYAHAEGIQNEHLKNRKTYKELMRMLRVHISSWRARSGCASVPDPYAQRAHKGRSMRVRNSIFLIIFKVPKTSKILKIAKDTNKWSQKLHEKKIFLPPQKKILLKIRLSIRIRNFAAPNEPLNITKNLILTLKSPPIETLWCKNHQNPSDRKSHTWAHLMSSLLVFNRVYRLEIQSVVLVFSTPLVN